MDLAENITEKEKISRKIFLIGKAANWRFPRQFAATQLIFSIAYGCEHFYQTLLLGIAAGRLSLPVLLVLLYRT